MKVEANDRLRFDREGYAICGQVIPADLVERLTVELTARFDAERGAVRSRIGGVRNLLQACPLVAAVAVSAPVQNLLHAMLGKECFPVRAIFFDKTPDANWSVAWHQDLHIAVAEKIATPGFGPWTVKAGVPHVQPPVEVLAGMVTLRLHLDDCNRANGALKVIPGSHARGVLADGEVAEWIQREAVCCEVPQAGAVLMRPLLLHASAPAENPSHRRVLHIEYATASLPNGLKWFERQ